MRAYVLTDARLASLAGRFVWLSIDTEKARNAAFLEAYPIDVWPTLLVIDPADGRAVLRWTGTATASEVERLAEDGRRAIRAGRGDAADEALARADRLAASRQAAEAAQAYREAIAIGGPGWSGRARAAEAVVQWVSLAGDARACAAAAREVLPLLPSGPRRGRAAGQGLSCAVEIEDPQARRDALAALEPAARAAVTAPGVLADDRSALYEALVGARAALGDEAGARNVARRWLAFLEAEAKKARTPAERAALDGQRVAAALRLGAPSRALPPLLATARAFPGDWVTENRLALVYLRLGRPADALAAADRAVASGEGPRALGARIRRAEALVALGRRADARETLEEMILRAEALPEAVRPRQSVARARALLHDLSAAP